MELIRSGHGEEKRAAAYLVWEDLTVSVMATNLRNGSSTRKLLCGLTGYAQPHRLMAVMGPSGSGKSTLLDSFAGRLSSNVVMTGTVVLSCRKSNLHSRDIAYATQDDVFLGTLTVRETLSYSAHLRLPATMTKDDVDDIVENTITKMGLQDCANNKIGNWHFRGISGGEKKRLSIGLQILTQPTILLLDEPTSGLDSASAFFVMEALRGIARDGRVVLCSTHQPSSDVFQLFDDLLLLSDGETVYFGETKNAIQFFADAGFPCPTRRNPPDHFLICINSDFDKVIATLMQTGRHIGFAVSSESPSNLTTREIRERLVQKYKCSEYSTNARKKIQEISLIGEQFRESNISYPSWWKQLCILTRRSSLNMSRDIGYYWLRLVFYILVSVSAGTLFFDIGTSNAAVISRGKCDGFIYGLMICLSIAGLPFFIEEVKVFRWERSGGHYGEAVHVLSNFLSSFPFVVAISISSGTVVNYMVKFHPGFSHYCYFIMNLFCCIAATEAFTLIMATLVPSLLMGIGASAGALVFMMMPSSLFCRLPDLPKVFWYYPMSYVSFAAWAIQGQFKNDMIGVEFEPHIPGQPKLKGEMLLQFEFGINPNHSKWRDLAAVLCLLICFKLLFYMMLKYKDRASSIFHRLCAKISILDSHRNPSRKE